MTTRSSHPAFGPALALGAGAIWSFGAILARLADKSDAFQYLAWRSVGIIVVLETWSLLNRQPHRTVQAFTSGRRMLIATVMLLLASLGFVYAIKTTTAANAAFLGSTTPLFGALAAKLVLHERLTRRTLVAIAIAFGGLIVMVAGDLEVGSIVGDLAALMAAIGFAGYTVAVRSDPIRDWSPVMPGYGLMLIVFCSIVTLARQKTLVPPTHDIGLALLHGGVIIVGGTLLYNAASHNVPAAAMTVFAQSEMVLVPIWAYLVLSETSSRSTVIGGSIIFAAVLGKALLDARAPEPHQVPPALPG